MYKGGVSMISIIPEGFNDFSCKGGDCRHTCCQVWEIDIDEDTAEYYRQLPGKLGDDLRQAMVREKDGTWHFRLNPEGYCYLLDPDGLCRVIRELGEDALCDICTVHPRFFTYVYEYILCGTGLCCEKTCEILAALPGPLHFTQEETGESFLFPELLEEMGLEALPEEGLHFAPDLTLAELERIIRDLGTTEPIDADWTKDLAAIRANLPAALDRYRTYVPKAPLDFFDRLYQFIFYRQLDQETSFGMEILARYAQDSTRFILLQAARTGDPLEAARRWSEQIEYDTENVGLLLSQQT